MTASPRHRKRRHENESGRNKKVQTLVKSKEPFDAFPVGHGSSIQTCGGFFSDPDPDSNPESQSFSRPDASNGLLSTQDHISLLEAECEIVCPTNIGSTLKLLKETLAHCSKTMQIVVEHQEPIIRSDRATYSSWDTLLLVLLLYEKCISAYDRTMYVLEIMYHSQRRTKHLPRSLPQEEGEQHRTVVCPDHRQQHTNDNSTDLLHPGALSIKLGTYDLDILEQACLYGGLVTLQLGSSKLFLEDLKSTFSASSLTFSSCNLHTMSDPQWRSISQRLQNVEDHLNQLREICAWYGANH